METKVSVITAKDNQTTPSLSLKTESFSEIRIKYAETDIKKYNDKYLWNQMSSPQHQQEGGFL